MCGCVEFVAQGALCAFVRTVGLAEGDEEAILDEVSSV